MQCAVCSMQSATCRVSFAELECAQNVYSMSTAIRCWRKHIRTHEAAGSTLAIYMYPSRLKNQTVLLNQTDMCMTNIRTKTYLIIQNNMKMAEISVRQEDSTLITQCLEFLPAAGLPGQGLLHFPQAGL